MEVEAWIWCRGMLSHPGLGIQELTCTQTTQTKNTGNQLGQEKANMVDSRGPNTKCIDNTVTDCQPTSDQLQTNTSVHKEIASTPVFLSRQTVKGTVWTCSNGQEFGRGGWGDDNVRRSKVSENAYFCDLHIPDQRLSMSYTTM